MNRRTTIDWLVDAFIVLLLALFIFACSGLRCHGQLPIRVHTETTNVLRRELATYMSDRIGVSNGPTWKGSAQWTERTRTNTSGGEYSDLGINTNFWLKTLPGWTALPYRISVYPPDYSAGSGGAVLISRYHFLTTAHSLTRDLKQNSFVWQGTNGTLTTNGVMGGTNLSFLVAGYGDLLVGILSNAVPDEVESVGVAEDSITNYTGIPFIVSTYAGTQNNQHFALRTATAISRISVAHARPTWRSDWWSSVPNNNVGGDSGGIAFMVINGRLGVLGCVSGSATLVRESATAIQSAVDQLSTTYGKPQQTLEVVTLP